MSLKFTKKDNPGTNPPSNPIVPPPLLAASASTGGDVPKFDQASVVAGARALIDAALRDTPKDRAFIDSVVAPAQDDLNRMDVLMGEGRSAEEAWEELDRIKRAAGVPPQE